MAWYEYQQEARQVPTMYELSGRAAKDGRKVFWLMLCTLGCFVMFPAAVLGAFGIISFGPSLFIIAVVLLIGVLASGRNSNEKLYERLHPYPWLGRRAKPWVERNGIIQRGHRGSEQDSPH